MLFVTGTGKIIDGPFTPDDTSGDIVIAYKKGKAMQCISNNYITNQALKGLKLGDTVTIEGMIDEREIGYPVVILNKVSKGTSKPPKMAKLKENHDSEYPKVTVRRRER